MTPVIDNSINWAYLAEFVWAGGVFIGLIAAGTVIYRMWREGDLP